MKKLLHFAFSLFFFSSVFSQRVTIQPSILDFHLDQAGVQAQTIRITNLSEKKISFQTYLADWYRDSVGAHHYFKPDTLSRSCASWVRLNKNFIEIEPGNTGEIVVQLQAPSDAASVKDMRWAMLFLQSADEQDSPSGNKKELKTEIKELLRVGIHIYQTPPALRRYAAKAIAFKQVASEKNGYELTIQNVGDVMLQCKAYVELTNIVDGKEYKLDKAEFPVFPEAIRKVKFSVPQNIPSGKYSTLAIVDVGEDMPLEAIETIIEIK
ncbi:MAG: hypothetical protein ICV66_07045 [Chitinophagaceae bacterium]|nr:hypothetical protein [Chitinophagaceae bacterium]